MSMRDFYFTWLNLTQIRFIVSGATDLSMDEVVTLRDTTALVENSSLACKLYYKPSAEEEGSYLVVGLLNHILFDRRVFEMIFVSVSTCKVSSHRC